MAEMARGGQGRDQEGVDRAAGDRGQEGQPVPRGMERAAKICFESQYDAL